jgi:addiction module RelB/DinJ family antitoxin
MMNSSQEQVVMSIRIDKEIKDKASEVFESMGTDLSGGIKLFLNHVTTEGALGFEPMTKDGLRFKYFEEYRRKLARERRVWKELYGK